ncbi:hypothetical protein VKT23_000022 [Stygiomarasmius scandens]|uniref:Uncharacterized protein n=1 Tax=Marasmiellus scandens TaxID=2682957 RepID=A0ABR1K6F3_9AGAR
MMFKNLLTVSLLNLNMISSTLCASFPPFSLIAPEFDSILPFNQAIEIGFEDNPPVLGLNRSIFISATYPRETEARVLYFDGPLYSGGRGFCQSSTNFTVHLQTDQAGRYDIHWNVTYSLSSDPSQAQDHECGPGPFTFESFVVNNTYRVLDPLVNQGWTPDPVEQPNAFTTISTASILTSVSEIPSSSATTSAFFGGVNGARNRSTMGSWTVLCMIFFMILNVTL